MKRDEWFTLYISNVSSKISLNLILLLVYRRIIILIYNIILV